MSGDALEYSQALGALQAAALRPALFVLGSGAVFSSGSKGLRRPAATVLAALHAKARQGGYRLAVVGGEGPVSPADVLAAVHDGVLGPIAHVSHVAAGTQPDDALRAVRESTGAAFGDMLVFAYDPALARAAQRCGAVAHPVPSGLDAAALQQGLDAFGKAHLDQRGF